MLTLVLPNNISSEIERALIRANRREIGGLLMAEHVGPNRFVVREITVNRIGTFASFVRRMQDVWSKFCQFFDQTKHDYTRFNYIGEWHSHPSFEPVPSGTDHRSMFEIITDESVGGHFVVLMVVKLNHEKTLVGSVHTYFPNGTAVKSELLIEGEISTHLSSPEKSSATTK